MKKCFLLVHSNLRRAKGQTFAIIVLILLASFMLNLWLMLATDYKQNFDRYHDRLNAEHVTLVIDRELTETGAYFSQLLENDGRTADYRLDPCMSAAGSFEYNGGKITSGFAILDKETALNRSIGKIEIVEQGNLTSGIYLPMIYKTEEITVGKTIAVTIGNHVVRYPICGFFNSVMTGSHNCGGLCSLILTKDKYLELEASGYAPASTLVSIRITDPSVSEDFETMLNDTVSGEYPKARLFSNFYTLNKQSRYISQMICSGIVSAMAFFVLLIALVVISSNIANYIQENMKILGALKAAGYTSKQLIGSLLMQFVSISLIAAMAGAGISYCLFPGVNTMMISQTGIPYAIHFLPLPLLLTLVISCGTVALATWLSSRRIRRLDPITALRQGMHTHNFKNNRIPLDRTRAPLHFALSLKTMLSGIKQNVIVSITMLVISLIVVFSGLMIKNVIVDMTPFIHLVIGETADSSIDIQSEAEEAFLREMSADERVEKIYLYHALEVRHIGGVGLFTVLCDDYSTVNNPSVCVEGRYPKYDNEVAIGISYARDMGLEIGDEITLTANDRESSYIISGFTQISDSFGKDCLLTRAGYQKLGSLTNLRYYLNLAEGVDIDDFHEDVIRQFGVNVNYVMNMLSAIEGTATVYVSLMTIIVIAILILSIIIITLVLYLLVRTMLNHKKRDYGILKALGFTTGQLMLQTAVSLMPTVILSTIAGLIICSLIINPLTSLFLSGLGVVKCSFALPTGFLILAGIVLIVFTFGIAFLLSLKIRRISPKELLAGE
ncbi:MAG: FtsX-like permease family protein [Lachnospiraceae bacterium]|nr:FtsX-like permease family protein [Lachnospiraceae bacterium]